MNADTGERAIVVTVDVDRIVHNVDGNPCGDADCGDDSCDWCEFAYGAFDLLTDGLFRARQHRHDLDDGVKRFADRAIDRGCEYARMAFESARAGHDLRHMSNLESLAQIAGERAALAAMHAHGGGYLLDLTELGEREDRLRGYVGMDRVDDD